MRKHRFLNLVVLLTVVASLVLTGSGAVSAQPKPSASAAPISTTDETKVPHYCGPYPTWVNSPLTSP